MISSALLAGAMRDGTAVPQFVAAGIMNVARADSVDAQPVKSDSTYQVTRPLAMYACSDVSGVVPRSVTGVSSIDAHTRYATASSTVFQRSSTSDVCTTASLIGVMSVAAACAPHGSFERATVNAMSFERVDGQPVKSASTFATIAPAGTFAVNVVAVVVPSSCRPVPFALISTR